MGLRACCWNELRDALLELTDRAASPDIAASQEQPPRGTVPRKAALVLAHDLTLDIKWTHEQIERFCDHFHSTESDDNDSDAPFNYRRFLRFVFAPLVCEQTRLELQARSATTALSAVYPSELVSESGAQDGLEHRVPVVAVKLQLERLDVENNGHDDALAALQQAVAALSLFAHPNITSYETTLCAKHAVYLVVANHASCTLKTILESFGAMREPTIRRYVLQLLLALQFLHARGVTHGYASRASQLIDRLRTLV